MLATEQKKAYQEGYKAALEMALAEINTEIRDCEKGAESRVAIIADTLRGLARNLTTVSNQIQKKGMQELAQSLLTPEQTSRP